MLAHRSYEIIRPVLGGFRLILFSIKFIIKQIYSCIKIFRTRALMSRMAAA